ncbi:type II toxin-antitoxin system HicB family antitoxin [Herbaspirillum sp. RTI4]|uniref:type II toxin-antitoxin system HicB family antitoxin n=1 Tax=Herbaspirillum sp. RTI4 TaxID=3048640 RepID=UPI002AB32A8C|nr:type II toxin-antitoxin system HicB family antitoxin [Herbaspirillum sp. RTI4]MDY7579069.1 type II toxin-antitoxin system HicB family antitoxin [Herbaspirillum sp. RTI4]MEA9982347.1 type II toxin-antitoxin system HicB family antitoxin [Herbaspirillum sp. RTI4]
MKYPIVIEPGNEKGNTAYGVIVPDLPGCFSAGDTLDEAIDNAKEAIELWLETVIDDGGLIPAASSISALQSKSEFSGWIWAAVSVDLSTLSDKAERVNITLPARVLRKIDAAAAASGESRSGYLARRALMA